MNIQIKAELKCVSLQLRFPSTGEQKMFGSLGSSMTGEFEIHPLNKASAHPSKCHVNIALLPEEERKIREIFTQAAARVVVQL